MPAKIVDIYFNVSLTNSVVVILESSDATRSVAQETANRLIESIPGRLANLYFLGNPNAYRVVIPRDFKEQCPAWFDQNKDRVSLVSPILEKLQNEEFNGKIVIVCSKLPVDIDDWQNTEVMKRTLFVNIGENTFSKKYTVIDSNQNTERITELLIIPVREIAVKGDGFVPVGYRFLSEKTANVIFKDGAFCLNIDSSEEKPECHIKALCQEDLPVLSIKSETGAVQSIKPKEEKSWLNLPDWQKIPEELKTIIHAGMQRQDYRCPQCNKTHTYNTLICPQGHPVLKGLPLHTCILFTKEEYLPLTGERYAYPLADHQKIITRDGNLYEWRNHRWYLINYIQPYEKIDDGVWAVFNKI